MSTLHNLAVALPPPAYTAAKKLKNAAAQVTTDLNWLSSNEARQTNRILRELRGRYTGRRAFIIGNGPSLGKMDLSSLRNEYTFGMNRIYLLFDKLGFETTFYVSVNRLVLEQCANDIQRLTMPKFLSVRGRQFFSAMDSSAFLRSLQGPLSFSLQPGLKVWESGTVTYVAMQLAFYMGFDTIYLIGVDHRFATSGPANKEVISAGNDPNHFSPQYFAQGFRWQLPDLKSSEQGYRLADSIFRSHGRRIYDATVNGALEIFEKVDFSKC